ncbi:MAG: dihydrodipicolinate synthase family protein [Gemmatimonadaceae bacterium]|nr:dihydrodipicolinate synthase family protein [Gemmatimonadaceae bacterium]
MAHPRAVLGGVFAAAVTPFDLNGTLDRDSARRNVRALLDAGLHGVLLAGSTGEAALLDQTERDGLLQAVRDEVPASRFLLMGVGTESTRHTIARAKHAATVGADAVLVVAPHYFTALMTPAAQRAHYLAVADASPVPVVLYSVPAFMHYHLDPDVVCELARHDNIIGIKDSSGNAEWRAGYLRAKGPTFAVMTGHAPSLTQALGEGCAGAVLAAASIVPTLALAVWHGVGLGHPEDAAEAQAGLRRLTAEVAAVHGVPGLKAAVDAAGMVGGHPRAPLLPLGDEARAAVAAVVHSLANTVA